MKSRGDSITMTAEQLRRHAAVVRAEFPESRAAKLYEMAARAQEIEETLRQLRIAYSPPTTAPSVAPDLDFPS
jgi:hypothetical protein